MLVNTHFNVLAFCTAIAAHVVIGLLWYSKLLFAETWAKESSTAREGKGFPLLSMAGQFISTVLFTLGIYLVVSLGGFYTIKGAALASCIGVICFVLPLNTGTLFFKRKPRLYFIESGYQALGVFVSTFILALWK
ncbi:MAG: DUF1761 domain-containing protein [Spirochaetota bacterium]